MLGVSILLLFKLAFNYTALRAFTLRGLRLCFLVVHGLTLYVRCLGLQVLFLFINTYLGVCFL